MQFKKLIPLQTAALLFTVVTSLLTSVAYSQSIEMPPAVRSMDENGINLSTGDFQASEFPFSIGNELSGLSRVSLGAGYAFAGSDNYSSQILVMPGPGASQGGTVVAQISYAGVIHSFIVGNWTNNLTTQQFFAGPYYDSKEGASLSCSSVDMRSAQGTCTLTTRNGTKVVYDKSLAIPNGYHTTVCGFAIHATIPNGEVQTMNYYLGSNGKPVAVKSVYTNLGWMLKYQINNSNEVIKVTGVNASSEYCDPSAEICTLLTIFPDMSSSQASAANRTFYRNGLLNLNYEAIAGFNPTTVTSAGGKVLIKSPVTLSYDSTINTMTFNITKNGSSWAYKFVFSSNPLGNPYIVGHSYVTYPDGGKIEYEVNRFGQITKVVDQLNRVMEYKYSEATEPSALLQIIRPEGGLTILGRDARGNPNNIITKAKSASPLPDLITTASYPTICNDSNYKTCNKPDWVRDARGNLPTNINNVDYRTDYTYSTVHGGVLTEKLPPNEQNVRLMTRYEYTPLYAQIKNSSGTLVNAEGPIYKLSKVSSCASTQTVCNLVGDTVTEYQYVHPNLLMTATIVRSGNNTVSATTLYEYDYVGNTTAVDGPLAGTVDKAYTTYDVLRRKVFEIGPDPDGVGPLKRQIVRHKYDADSLETRTESGTVNDSNGDAFSYAAFNIANPDLAPYTWATAKNMYYDGAAQLIKTEVVVP